MTRKERTTRSPSIWVASKTDGPPRGFLISFHQKPSVLKNEYTPPPPLVLKMYSFCTHFCPGAGEGPARWKRAISRLVGTLHISLGAHYSMGFCGNCVAAESKMTGEDRSGHEWTPADIFCENSA